MGTGERGEVLSIAVGGYRIQERGGAAGAAINHGERVIHRKRGSGSY